MLKTFGIKYFDHIKTNYLNLFLTDTKEIKISCISGLSEVIKMMVLDDAYKLFSDPICEFITNVENIEDSELMKKTMPIIPEIMEVMNPRKNNEEVHEIHRQFYEDFMECLLALNKKFETKWRLQFSLLKIFSERK
jgi:hypothetical protein